VIHGTVVHMILRIMLRPSHRSFAWLSQNILSRLLVIDLQAGKFRTIPAMKYRPAVCSPFPPKWTFLASPGSVCFSLRSSLLVLLPTRTPALWIFNQVTYTTLPSPHLHPPRMHTAVLQKIPHSNCYEFQARARNTLAFRAMACSATHRYRTRRPAS